MTRAKKPQISHRDLVMEMAGFAEKNTAHGLTLFIADFALFSAAIAGVLFAPHLALKLLASIVAGAKMANLASLGHDAAHNSLTASRRLNWLLGVLSFMPCLFNYRLWVYDHHALHHPHVNGDHVDSFKPLSKAEYDALPPSAQAWHRFIRSGNPLAFGLYYICQRWWQVKLMPRAFLPRAQHASAWKHFAFVATYFAAFTTLLACAPLFAPVSLLEAVALGLLLPFFIFQALMSASLYINHTHPDIPWFTAGAPRALTQQAEMLTVHLRLPRLLAKLVHHFFDHPAHHVYPAIPCYQLGKAQERMNELLGERAVVVDFSFSALARIVNQCKLYDYENHRWLDYQGVPTTPVCRPVAEYNTLPR